MFGCGDFPGLTFERLIPGMDCGKGDSEAVLEGPVGKRLRPIFQCNRRDPYVEVKARSET